MFPLEKEGRQELKLFLFQKQIQPLVPMIVQSYSTLGYEATDCKLPSGQWNIIIGIPIRQILDQVQTLTIVEPPPAPVEQSVETFKASLKLSVEKFKEKLTRNDIQALNRIIKKL